MQSYDLGSCSTTATTQISGPSDDVKCAQIFAQSTEASHNFNLGLIMPGPAADADFNCNLYQVVPPRLSISH